MRETIITVLILVAAGCATPQIIQTDRHAGIMRCDIDMFSNSCEEKEKIIEKFCGPHKYESIEINSFVSGKGRKAYISKFKCLIPW